MNGLLGGVIGKKSRPISYQGPGGSLFKIETRVGADITIYMTTPALAL